MESDLEVEMELVYEWVADCEADFLALADTLEDAWFHRAEDTLGEIEVIESQPDTLRMRMMRLIGFSAAA